ncbi:hypothetical protein GCM10020254_85100 [Streptomyces goshikiensis]
MKPAPQVCRPQGEQLAIGVQRERITPVDEGPGGEDHVRVADEKHAQRRDHQLRKVTGGRQRGHRQPGGYGSDHGDPVPLVQPECRHRGRRDDEGEQWTRNQTPVLRCHQEQDEHGGGQDDGRPVNVRDVEGEGVQL